MEKMVPFNSATPLPASQGSREGLSPGRLRRIFRLLPDHGRTCEAG